MSHPVIEAFSLSQNEKDQFVLRRPGGDDVADVRIRRAFPWSMPDRFISIRTADGKELLLLEDLGALNPSLRKMIEQRLEQQSFVPKITRIRDVDVRFGYQQWRVETDRGPAEFRVQEREDIRFLHDGRFSIKDADGNVYELASLIDLDQRSRHAVEALL